jgi:hypothetical protein
MKISILAISVLLLSALASAEVNVSGRFQLVQLGSMRRDQFLIDTQTGRIWNKTCAISSDGSAADCDLGYWSEEWVAGLNITQEAVFDVIEKAKNKNAKPNQKRKPFNWSDYPAVNGNQH